MHYNPKYQFQQTERNDSDEVCVVFVFLFIEETNRRERHDSYGIDTTLVLILCLYVSWLEHDKGLSIP